MTYSSGNNNCILFKRYSSWKTKWKSKDHREERKNEQIIYCYLIIQPEARKRILQTFVEKLFREIFLQTYETALFSILQMLLSIRLLLLKKCRYAAYKCQVVYLFNIFSTFLKYFWLCKPSFNFTLTLQSKKQTKQQKTVRNIFFCI